MKVTPFLMFEGHAEEAMNFYIASLPDSAIISIERYGAGEQGKEGSVKRASFRLGTQTIMCIDSPVHHAFTFTPATSLFVECGSESELDTLFAKFSDGGQILMPLSNYGFSKKFGWCNDHFGVSWQFNWA